MGGPLVAGTTSPQGQRSGGGRLVAKRPSESRSKQSPARSLTSRNTAEAGSGGKTRTHSVAMSACPPRGAPMRP